MNDFIKTNSGTVINTNRDDFEKFKMIRQQKIQEKKLTERVEYLEKQLKQLTEVVNKLIG